MRWDPGHKSPDVIDRRGQGGGRGVGQLGSLLSFLPLILRMRFGWLIVLLALGGWYVMNHVGVSGPDAGAGAGGQGTSEVTGDPRAAGAASDRDQKEVQFVSFVLDDVQATWAKEFAARGRTYRNAKLVLFTNSTRTGCGYGESATGPFYCPSDERVYIDLGFYDELARRFGAKGDFAQAYVIAHEIGHHVQKQLGLSDRVAHAAQADRRGEDSASVRLELQADCFAGLWAHATEKENLLEAGDLDEALGAASAIGDYRLKKQATGRVQPENWTHGSSAERSRWLKRGYEQPRIEACDTFAAREL
jgi:predicted metalloprotease